MTTVSIQYITPTVRNGFILVGKSSSYKVILAPYSGWDLDKLLNFLSLVIFLLLDGDDNGIYSQGYYK